MNCQNFEDAVSDLARDQMMEAEVREAALLHCSGCESCAKRLSEERVLTQNLRQLSLAFRSIPATSMLSESLRDEFRKHQFTVTAPSSVLTLGARWYAAAAAVLLLTGAVAAVRWISTSESTVAPLSIAAVNVEDQTKTESVNPIVTPSSPPAKPTVRKRQIKRAPSSPRSVPKAVGPMNAQAVAQQNKDADSSKTEVATDFMPIGYTTALNVQDGGQVVRVVLPRSAMERFGLPVNMDRYDERVKADVLVSADGMARAIRFVQ